MIRYNTKRMEKDRIRRNQIDFIYKRNTRRYVTRDGGCGQSWDWVPDDGSDERRIFPKIGQEIKIYTHMHVREDDVSLFGFLSKEEKEAFELLIGVNGIGPKVGLSVLSTLSVYELKMAVISEDVKIISKTPGLGPKGAKKLILELKDKLSFEELEEDGVGAEIFDTSADSSDSVMITIEGLVSLGYSKSEAAIAVNKVEDAKDLTPEELLKKALKNIMI